MNINEVEKHVKFDLIFTLLLILGVGLCFLLSIVFIFKPDSVKAKEITNSININSKAYMPCGSTQYNGKYCAYLNNGTYAVRNINTTYFGVLNGLTFQFGDMISAKPQYTMVIEAMSTDFRNNSFDILVYGSTQSDTQGSLLTNYTYSFISKSKLQIIFTTDTYSFHTVIISGNPLTGINTYGIKKVTLSYDDGVNDNSDIINSSNQNTEDIINNANSNTEEVTNKITETFNQMVTNGLQANNNERKTLSNMCKNIYFTPINKGKRYSGYTNLVDDPLSFYISDYIPINSINDDSLGGNANTLYINEPLESTANYYIYFYKEDKTGLGYWDLKTRSITIPNNAYYFRFSSLSANTTVSRYSNECIKSEDKVYGYLSDDTNPSVDENAITNTFNSVQTNNPLAYLLTLPTDLLTAILNGLSSNTCQDFEIGKFGHVGRHDLGTYTFKFPCINLQEKLGNNLYNTIDLFVSIGILVITIVKLYNTISSYLTLGAEDEVKSHSHFLTPMDFLGNILGGNISGVGNSINNGGTL